MRKIAYLLVLTLSPAVFADDLCTRVPEAPTTVSHEMRQAIIAWPVQCGSTIPAAPSSDDEWRKSIDAFRQIGEERVPALLEQYRVALKRGKLSGTNVHWLSPYSLPKKNSSRLVLYLHGGAYISGSGDSGVEEGIIIASRVEIPVLSVDYRMPPDNPFPAAVEDAVSVYRELLNTRSSRSIIIGGSSAGGGLALATALRLRELGLPMPGAIYAGSPWADLTKTGETMFTNETVDRFLFSYESLLQSAAQLYAGEADLRNPSLSPVYGDFRGFPPTILISGTRDLFLSDVVRTHRKLRQVDVAAELHVFEGMSHGGYLVFSNTPESLEVYRELSIFIAKHLD